MASQTSKKPLTVEVTLTGSKIVIEGVRCEIALPLENDGVVPIKCFFEIDDVRPLALDFEFSLAGDINDMGGIKRGEIRANCVYKNGITTTYFSPDRGEAILSGEAADFRQTTFFPNETQLEAYITNFWLTRSLLLEPARSIGKRYDTGVIVESHMVRTYQLAELGTTRFESHLVYHDDPKRDFSATSRLVATVRAPESGDTEKQLKALEQFLALVSFAERQRCACYGYSRCQVGSVIEQYRGNVGIPASNEKHSSNVTLIDPSNFDEFIADCYPRLQASPYRAFLIDAMTKLGGSGDRTLEHDFTAYFAGLENLLNAYRDIKQRHGILVPTEWKTFENDVKAFVKGHPSFSSDPIKRGLLYGKLGELNRPSFGAVLQDFAQDECVDLSGVWPVVSPVAEGLNLYQIRNHIVHGRLLPHASIDPLIAACDYLRWTLERCLLSILKWDIAKSRVSAAYLSMATYVWEEESRALKKIWGPNGSIPPKQ